jgi:hypothetical protein
MKLKSCPITERICTKKCAWYDEDLKDCRVILALMGLGNQGDNITLKTTMTMAQLF